MCQQILPGLGSSQAPGQPNEDSPSLHKLASLTVRCICDSKRYALFEPSTNPSYTPNGVTSIDTLYGEIGEKYRGLAAATTEYVQA